MSKGDFLRRIERLPASTRSGFIPSNPDNYRDFEEYRTSQGWEMRIAIIPTRDNILRAAKILANLFDERNEDLDWKFLYLYINPEDDFDSLGIDPVNFDLDSSSDRNQQGKEICIYMRNRSDGSNEKTPEQWKELILACWKALADANIPLGYAGCPQGDRALVSEPGIVTPFTYTSTKPFTNRHGLLHEEDYNPHHFEDPFEGIIITRDDLRSHGLTDNPAAIQTARAEYLARYKQQLRQRILEILNALNNVALYCVPNLTHFESFYQQYLGADNKQAFITENMALLRSILHELPRKTESRLTPHDAVKGLLQALNQKNDEAIDRELNNIAKLLPDLKKEMLNIQEEFAQLSQDSRYDNSFKQFSQHFDACIDFKPATMQLLYRQIRHYIYTTNTNISAHTTGIFKRRPDVTQDITKTRQLNGVPEGQTIQVSTNPDEDLSLQIFGTSVFSRYSEGVRQPSAKHSDDKIVIGCTYQGLPFQIVVDGFLFGERPLIFKFIDDWVTPLMNEYANELVATDNPEDVIRKLIHQIFTLRQEKSPHAEFTMSIAITYEKNEQTFSAGFGIGDTGLLLRRPNQSIEQLVKTAVKKQGFKEGFRGYQYDTETLDDVIDRNSIFHVAVNPGDEIVGYTYLFENSLRLESENDTMQYFTVNQTELDPSVNLFGQLCSHVTAEYDRKCTEAAKGNDSCVFGDDCMLGSVEIPTTGLRYALMERTYQTKVTCYTQQIDTIACSERQELHRKFLNDIQTHRRDSLEELSASIEALDNFGIKSIETGNAAMQNNNHDSLLLNTVQPARSSCSIGWNVLASFMLLSGGLMVVAGVLSLLFPVPPITMPMSAALIATGSASISGSLGIFATQGYHCIRSKQRAPEITPLVNKQKTA